MIGYSILIYRIKEAELRAGILPRDGGSPVNRHEPWGRFQSNSRHQIRMKSLMSDSAPIPLPTFRQALRFWGKLGLISFGGPAGQIAIMHRELVERKRWITEDHFLHAVNFCMLLPGPEAQQLATYLGWRLHGARGGVAAGSLFVLPSVLILLG